VFRPGSLRARKELLVGKRVKLEQDPTQGSRDVYGRVLAYVWLEDGTFVNEVMIAGGFAQEYTYRNPYRYQADFREAEAEPALPRVACGRPRRATATRDGQRTHQLPLRLLQRQLPVRSQHPLELSRRPRRVRHCRLRSHRQQAIRITPTAPRLVRQALHPSSVGTRATGAH
jgi:hypothetical protein